MTKVLLVENNRLWQGILREELEALVPQEEIKVVDNYWDAIANINPEISAYILDGRFPNVAGGKPEQLGVNLAIELHNRGVDYERIAIISFSSEYLQTIMRLGMNKVYSKGGSNENTGVRGIEKLVDDLKPLFTQG